MSAAVIPKRRKPRADLGPPDTIKRLLALRPGENFVYYRGYFQLDIKNSGSMAASLLKSVMNTAINLEREGRARLSERQAAVVDRKFFMDSNKSPAFVTEYIATGVKVGDA